MVGWDGSGGRGVACVGGSVGGVVVVGVGISFVSALFIIASFLPLRPLISISSASAPFIIVIFLPLGP